MICAPYVGEEQAAKFELLFRDEPKVHYNLIKYKKMHEYKITKNISENVTLVKLMDSLGNANHSMSVVGNWIFDSNYEKALVLNKE